MEYNDANLLLLDGQGLSYSEIATKLEVTRSVVAGRIKRIKDGKIAQTSSRKPRVHPAGKLQDYSKRKPPAPASYPRTAAKPVKGRQKPNKQSIYLKPFRHVEMTKSEMYEDLRKAVENTK